MRDSEIVPNARYRFWRRYQAGGPDESIGFALTWVWGDLNYSGQVDFDDVTCMNEAFAGRYDACGFGIEAADLLPCDPDHFIDLEDLIALVSAFGNTPYSNSPYPQFCTLPCQCEESGGFQPPGGGSPSEGVTASITLAGTSMTIAPDEKFEVEIFAETEAALRGYQFALIVDGGTVGELTLVDLSVDSQRTDFGFYGTPSHIAIDLENGRAAGVSLGDPAVFQPPKYSATFLFHAAPEAQGVFRIELREDDTQLRDANGNAIEWSLKEPLEIIVIP